jgi:hypothetical protein
MQAGSYRSSLNGEPASERQRKLRCHFRKRHDGIPMPPSPKWSGTGPLSRAMSVRIRPAATTREGQKL